MTELEERLRNLEAKSPNRYSNPSICSATFLAINNDLLPPPSVDHTPAAEDHSKEEPPPEDDSLPDDLETLESHHEEDV